MIQSLRYTSKIIQLDRNVIVELQQILLKYLDNPLRLNFIKSSLLLTVQ